MRESRNMELMNTSLIRMESSQKLRCLTRGLRDFDMVVGERIINNYNNMFKMRKGEKRHQDHLFKKIMVLFIYGWF